VVQALIGIPVPLAPRHWAVDGVLEGDHHLPGRQVAPSGGEKEENLKPVSQLDFTATCQLG
jgi:hypothetical protein